MNTNSKILTVNTAGTDITQPYAVYTVHCDSANTQSNQVAVTLAICTILSENNHFRSKHVPKRI
jgi:hypothetical protein